MAYLDRISDRLRFVLAQGRSPDDPADPDWDRVNCRFDMASCRSAMNHMGAVPVAWIDFPKDGPAYPLDADLVNRFTANPLAQALRGVMQSDEQWKIQQLWDDGPAIFLLRPEAFRKVGEHYEPAVTPTEMRKILGEIVSAR
ncbi:hypothetical protein IC232_03660 [Microvirga sp. BT688]|uniref:hypothetical protein n=1 Tax=Microvirga sp. TaxID=1873136 RepID=UPI001683E82A|nr:hypothetical protein [Microvirga sp.]MBD2745787.1 hypothetical protein [Microvirga sp.]